MNDLRAALNLHALIEETILSGGFDAVVLERAAWLRHGASWAQVRNRKGDDPASWN